MEKKHERTAPYRRRHQKHDGREKVIVGGESRSFSHMLPTCERQIELMISTRVTLGSRQVQTGSRSYLGGRW